MAESAEKITAFIQSISDSLELVIRKIRDNPFGSDCIAVMHLTAQQLAGLASLVEADSAADPYLKACTRTLAHKVRDMSKQTRGDQRENIEIYNTVVLPEWTQLKHLFSAAAAGKAMEGLMQQYPENISPDEKILVGAFTYGKPDIKSWGEHAVLKIGRFCSIADDVTIFLGGEHRSDWVTTYPFSALLNEFSAIEGHPRSKGDVVIGNDVWIGYGATLLSGVRIGDGAVIGARAVVGRDIPPYAIAAGNPAAVIKYRFEPPLIEQLLQIKWWDWDISDIQRAVPLLLSPDIAEFIRYANKRNAPQ